jgi:hypothetical protein
MNAKKTNKRTLRCYLRRMDLAIAEWRLRGKRVANEGDAELAEQYATDAADLTAFREAFAAEDFETAGRLADAMDTIVRDQIPLQVYYTVFPNR